VGSDKVLKQELGDNGEFQRLFKIHLLFEEKPNKPDTKTIQEALEKKFGKTEIVSGDKALTSFAVNKYSVAYKEGSLPPQVLMMDVQPFQQDTISELERTQLWDVKNSGEILSNCKYRLIISDMMAAGLEYKERCDLLVGWLEAALSLFPTCTAIWVPSAGKLLTTEQVMNYRVDQDKFIFLYVNVRFFTIQNTEDMVVDTLGLYAIGLPDVQYHFHHFDPNHVVGHAYNVASYLFNQNAPIKHGETIDGLEGGQISRDVQWPCHYEDSLIQPVREVMDICMAEYASGKRQ
jgi:hypothetical protein